MTTEVEKLIIAGANSQRAQEAASHQSRDPLLGGVIADVPNPYLATATFDTREFVLVPLLSGGDGGVSNAGPSYDRALIAEMLRNPFWFKIDAIRKQRALLLAADNAAAENVRTASLASPPSGAVHFFAADPSQGEFNKHDSLESARKDAEGMLEWAGDEAADSGWADDPPQICYGVIVGMCREKSRKPAPEGSEFEEFVEYQLVAASTTSDSGGLGIAA